LLAVKLLVAIVAIASEPSNKTYNVKVNVSNTLFGTGVTSLASVRAGTTATGTLGTSFEDGDTIDGVTLATNDRILIKNQSTGAENGIYIVQASGAPTRASDYASGVSVASTFVFVQEGTTNADTGWLCTNNPYIKLCPLRR